VGTQLYSRPSAQILMSFGAYVGVGDKLTLDLLRGATGSSVMGKPGRSAGSFPVLRSFAVPCQGEFAPVWSS
jgi:hypothetical protein